MQNQSKAFLFAGLTMLSWSTVSTAYKVALESLSTMQLIYVCMAAAALFLLVVMAVAGRLRDFLALRPGQVGTGMLLGVTLYLYFAFLFAGYDRLPAQIAQPVNYTWSLVFALLAAWQMKQRLSKKELFWMLVAYSGVVVISSGASGTLGPLSPLGLACVAASTVIFAVYWLINANNDMPSQTGLILCFATSFALAACTMAIKGESFVLPLRPVLAGAYVGLFDLAVPYILWGLAIRLSSSVARISTIPFLGPFLGLVWIHLVLHEPIAWTTVPGLMLIAGGTLMQQKAAAGRKDAGAGSSNQAA
ncbi:MAG: DMT family transporter [Mailhella sp.]|nr:DMT family transporter [Mailhella sp.]